MSRRAWVVAGLAWLGVVVVVSALTWTVIESAGEGVLRDPEPVTVVVAGADSESPATEPTPSRSATKRPNDSDSVDASPAPGAAATSEPPSPSASSTRKPSPDPGPTPAATHVRTWRGAAGLVSVRCSGSRASLQGASPAAGWHVEVEARGPEAVVVELKTVGEAEREVKVAARCVGGQPHFTVESDAGGDD